MLKAKHILIINDVRIDGDTMGSSLGMHHALCKFGKHVTHISPVPIGPTFDFLPGRSLVTQDPAVLRDSIIDLVVAFDCADGNHVLDFRSRLPSRPVLISFDHHITNPRYGDVNIVSPDASSTGEVVWRFLKQNHVPISQEAATCLLTAICTDTTFFSNDATNQVCLEAASDLGLSGARVHDVVRAFYANKPVSLLRLWGAFMERLIKLPDGSVVTYVKREDVPEDENMDLDTSALANFLMSSVSGAPIVCVLSEKLDGSVKFGLRGSSRDVSEIALRHGGGGHVKAAGFSVPAASVVVKDGGIFVRRGDGNDVAVYEYLE